MALAHLAELAGRDGLVEPVEVVPREALPLPAASAAVAEQEEEAAFIYTIRPGLPDFSW
jgi:hypothetical protein